MAVFSMSEGWYTVDEAMEITSVDENKSGSRTNKPHVLISVQPFLVRTGQDIILLDSGLGYLNEHGLLRIHENLRELGLDPTEVTKILLSHLHRDHADGIYYLRDGQLELSFPNAAIFVQEQELEFAISKGGKSYNVEKLKSLQRSSIIRPLNGNGEINEFIQYEVSGGHSPFHQVFIIKTLEEKLFFGGDVVPVPEQLLHKYIAKYDYDSATSALKRREYAERATKEGWRFLFYHSSTTPSAYVRKEKNSFKIIPQGLY